MIDVGSSSVGASILRIVRGVMLKDTSLVQLQNPIIALCIFTAVAVSIAMLRYRRTLD